MSDDPASEQVTGEHLPVLTRHDESALLEPVHELLTADHAAVAPHVERDVMQGLGHARLQVVLDEHGGHGAGGRVQVLPGGQHQLLPAVEQLPGPGPHLDHDALGVDAEQGEGEDGLAKVEEAVKEDELQVDAGELVHDQGPDAESGADKH